METSRPLTTGNATAKKAAAILLDKKIGFIIPTPKQRQNLLVAFVKKNMIVYGRAFDIVKLLGEVDLDDLASVEKNLKNIRIYEIKSTNKNLAPDFSKYFFSISAAEVLVAQSLKAYFKFIFVNINTGDFLEMDLNEMFNRSRGIYPSWSIMF